MAEGLVKFEDLEVLTYFVTSQKSFDICRIWVYLFSVTKPCATFSTENLTIISNFDYSSVADDRIEKKMANCVVNKLLVILTP